MKLKDVRDGQMFTIGQTEYTRQYQYKRAPLVTVSLGGNLLELPEDTEVTVEENRDPSPQWTTGADYQVQDDDTAERGKEKMFEVHHDQNPHYVVRPLEDKCH